ncbi:MAG: response regulator transcription factor [Eubacteriales bacterium]|nr:response regulator transcription factor [Eubacteriales bacterium]
MAKKVRILIVEDQTILLDALAESLSLVDNFTIVGKTTDASETLDLCRSLNPDLVLMDICSADGNTGFSETRKIKEALPTIKVLLMTGMPDQSFVSEGKNAGADSFVYKNVSKEELISTINNTVLDYSSFPEDRDGSQQDRFDLTDRENDILRLVCQGKNRKEIAEALFLSENTIRNNINRILMKTNYDSIAQLAIFAVSKGYIVP